MIKMRIGLPLKFFLSLSAVILLTSLSLTWFFIRYQVVQVRQTLEDRCNTLARNLAYNSEYGVLTANKGFLHTLTEGVTKEDDVVYALLYDKNGELLASTETPGSPHIFKEIEPLMNYKLNPVSGSGSPLDPANRKKTIGLTYTSRAGTSVHDVICPIMSRRIATQREEMAFLGDIELAAGKEELAGFARVGISLSRMHTQVAALRNGVLLLTLVVVLFGLLLSIFLIRIIVSPLKDLALGTKKIATGDLDYRVEVKSDDEIGDLADLFNEMAQDLKNHIKELNKEKEHLLNLKQALEQRTNELEETLVKMKNIQQELLRSEKFATIGRLASSVAHELRNPLASLKNISYYLLKLGTFAGDEKAKRMLEMLSNDVGRANKIVTDLLDFSRVKKLSKVPTNIDEFIDKLLDNMTMGENVTIVRELEKAEVNLDPDRITQVLINLVTNARDAMGDGGTITVSARRSGDLLEILVKDTGCGMDKETADRIFEPLFTTKTKGLGLGLAIVKEIIDAHYGRISVSSEKGKGTTFEILLPIA
ncbi:MAG: ATP-binding protein [Endomicrobiales bacterium]